METPQSAAPEAPLPEGFVCVLATSDRRSATHGALVLESRQVPWDLVPSENGLWRLVVPHAAESAARRELSEYLAENRRVEIPLSTTPAPGAWLSGLVYALVLVAAALAERGGLLGADPVARGAVDALAMEAGEWWRAATALTLHSGPVHLLANLLFGALFGVLLAEVVGGGLAWAAIVLAGTAGNLANALAHADGHLSIGASTAVFGALGLLGGFEGLRRGNHRMAWRRRWAPLLGALALFALFGSGGGNESASMGRTDVAAHLFGFLGGLLLSPWLVFLSARVRPGDLRAQSLAAAFALGVPAGAWWWALS